MHILFILAGTWPYIVFSLPPLVFFSISLSSSMTTSPTPSSSPAFLAEWIGMLVGDRAMLVIACAHLRPHTSPKIDVNTKSALNFARTTHARIREQHGCAEVLVGERTENTKSGAVCLWVQQAARLAQYACRCNRLQEVVQYACGWVQQAARSSRGELGALPARPELFCAQDDCTASYVCARCTLHWHVANPRGGVCCCLA